jgi:hypothetical protein
MELEFITDYNPYHDPKNGQFTTGPGGVGSTSALAKFNKQRATSHKKVAGELRSHAEAADKAGKPKLAQKLRSRAEKHEEFEKKYKSGELTKNSPAVKKLAEKPKPAPEKKPEAEKPKPAPTASGVVPPFAGKEMEMFKEKYVDRKDLSLVPKVFTEVSPKAYAEWQAASSQTWNAEMVAGSRYKKDSKAINEALLQAAESGVPVKGRKAAEIKSMNSYLERFKTEKDTVVFRGTSEDDLNKLLRLPVGDVTDNPAFASTSLNPQVARGFTFGKTVLRVNLPKGKGGILPFQTPGEPISATEMEIVIPPGAKLLKLPSTKMVIPFPGGMDEYEVINLQVL